MQYWLMKTEPESFSISDLERLQVEPWSGVRSNFARSFMRKMEVGDGVLFYHSSTEPPGVAGLAQVERTKVIDETQFDPASPYFEPKATREKPIWDCVDVRFVSRLPYYVTLSRIRGDDMLADMALLRIGRLSVQPVTELEYKRVVELGHIEPPPEPPKAKRAKKKPAKTKSAKKSKPKAKAKAAKSKSKKPKKR
jgi:predicted RNA-binding protein with PUA-like domain